MRNWNELYDDPRQRKNIQHQHHQRMLEDPRTRFARQLGSPYNLAADPTLREWYDKTRMRYGPTTMVGCGAWLAAC